MNQTALQKTNSNTDAATDFAVLKEQATMLCKTGFLPQAIKTPEQAIAIILTGRELGIGTMAALNTINVIQGKPTISPQLMLALIERSGQLENIEIEPHNGNAIRCTMKRKGRSPHTEYFGETEAAAMQLAGKDNYKKQAATMYKWRAIAACARAVFADVILGLYTPDEMGADVNEDGEITPMQKPNVLAIAPPQQEQPADEVVTPENEREFLIGEVNDLCRELNRHNDSIKWSGKVLKEYVDQQFETTDGLDSLDFDAINQLILDLQERLDALKIGEMPR